LRPRLAGGKQPLSVGGEQVFRLRPLSLPAPEATMAAARASDAVSLFAQRAAAARGDFFLSLANVAAVAEISRRLDGIPLAIELAAARVAALRPAEIAGLLDERFRLLTRGRADAASRQQTLQAAVEWSYALLGQAERQTFDCMGVLPRASTPPRPPISPTPAACGGGLGAGRALAVQNGCSARADRRGGRSTR
jgi:predicted ATPase